MTQRRRTVREVLGAGLALSAVTLLPYLALALIAAQQGRVFVGHVYNLYDGLSYLAKMQQGYQGQWRFRLPYTADAEPTAYLFLFHLALGHLSRVLQVDVRVMYHAARVAGILAMTAALYAWFRALAPWLPQWRRAWWLALFATGMEGWSFLLLLPEEALLVPEIYPALSALVNAHFPWALALLALALHPAAAQGVRSGRGRGWRWWALAVVSGLGLALVAPFGVVVAVTAWTLYGLANRDQRAGAWGQAALLGLAAGPYLLYLFWAVRADPWLAGWNAQNRTPIEGVLPTLLRFAPWWALLWPARRHRGTGWLWAWMAASWLWALAPLALQRRMWLGVGIPMVALAAWWKPWPRWARWATALAIGPTWGLLLVLPLVAAGSPNATIFLTRDEKAALDWLAAQRPPGQRVLTGPLMGAYVPAFTPHRVFYGHFMETYPAEDEKAWVETLLCEPDARAAWRQLRARRVEWIFWTRYEAARCAMPAWMRAFPLAWQQGDVYLYRVPETPIP